MVEGAGLENRWALTGLVGSNPTLSVISKLILREDGRHGATVRPYTSATLQ